jgi:Putative F0F1-ATPase subunit Ca2+/Mg2+ transporter
MKKYLVFVGMGFELIGIVLAGLWIGMWLENQKPMKNLWPVLLVFLGLSGWFYRVTLLLKKINKENEE